MVFGKSSQFTEGFASFTADDNLMLANLKQAINYSKESLAISDPTLQMPNAPIPVNTTSNRELPNNISSMSTPTMAMTAPMGNMSTPTMAMMAPMDNMSTPTMAMTAPMDNMSTPTMAMMAPMDNMNASSSTTMPTMMRNGSSGGLSQFKNIPRVMNNANENEDIVLDGDDEDAVLDEEDNTNTFEEDAEDKRIRNSKKDKNNKKDMIEEGFQGSIEIQSRNIRNILLALLLSCIGYLIVYSMTNSLIPLNDISPQLLKFKRFIYGGLFFLISYICLEVF
jgi:hypothetical protein